jgi:hypothetical protein
VCSHADHEITQRPDGVVAETHVFTDDHMARLVAAVDRMVWHMNVAAYAHGWPKGGNLPFCNGGS